MKSRRKRILVAVDGSDQALDVVNYISKAVTIWQSEVVLFHVMDIVPDTFWDWERDPLTPQYLSYLKDWESRKEQEISEFMERARRVLLDEGIPEDAVQVNISKRKEGIARDILTEAEQDYDAVALGRFGRGAIEDSVLGSVANKVLFSLTNVPLCLVGGRPKLGKVLVGIDNSAGSLKAVDFTAKALAAGNPSVTLANVMRLPYEGFERVMTEEQAHKLMENAQKNVRSAFRKATKMLVSAGVDPKRLTSKVITGASRALALLNEAKHGRYGTLVVGRKGVSNVADFKMGRVATKVIQVSKEMAVWIVG